VGKSCQYGRVGNRRYRSMITDRPVLLGTLRAVLS
jgi:hypothetical protein